MKKFFLPILLIAAVTSAYGAPFTPEKMTISAQPTVQYNFDGSVLHVPVTVSGKAAYSVFMVYTQDKGSAIGSFRNGLLGWHYVNKMDTCVYMREVGLLPTGPSDITWDGKNTYGSKVPEGAYTYYIWGYDNQTPVYSAAAAMVFTNDGWGEESNILYMEDKDENGVQLTNPNAYISLIMNYAARATVPMITHKWRIGSDPQTAIGDYEFTTTGRGDIHRTGASIALDPKDHTMLYVAEMGPDYGTYMTKYQWVPGGASTLQTDWGSDGTYHWTTETVPGWLPMTGVVSDGADLLFMSYMNQIDSNPFSQMLYIDRETGDKVKTVDTSAWYCNKTESEVGGQMNGGPSDFDFQNGLILSQGNFWCTTMAIDPTRDTGDEIVWVNKNGDYIHDKNFLPDAESPWMCNSFKTPPWTYTWKADNYGFCVFNVNNVGTATFGVIAPSGQGMSYFSIAGATEASGAVMPLNVGSAYDGIYKRMTDNLGIGYLAYDVYKGVISKDVGVADAAPAAFSVAQNSPNPFNPTTTVSFNLAKAGKVTVDVFNISGQKVDTLVNTTMSAGAHSVTWNAANHSAGVYFYTVKSGSYSKTMKMTLLK